MIYELFIIHSLTMFITLGTKDGKLWENILTFPTLDGSTC